MLVQIFSEIYWLNQLFIRKKNLLGSKLSESQYNYHLQLMTQLNEMKRWSEKKGPASVEYPPTFLAPQTYLGR